MMSLPRYRRLFLSLALVLSSTVLTFAQEGGPDVDTAAIQRRKDVQADMMFFEAMNARQVGNSVKAEALLKEVVRLNPDESGSYYELARLAMEKNNPKAATEYIKKAMQLDKDNRWYQRQYAQVLISQNKFEEAADLFREMSEQDEDNIEFMRMAAALYQRSGDNKKALQFLDRLITKSGGDEQFLLQKQQVYMKMNDIEGAAKTIQQLIDANPKVGRYYLLLAEVYENNNMPEKAAQVYDKVLKEFPEDEAVQYSLALYYKKTGREAEYNEFAKKAITNQNFDPETQISLMIPYLQELIKDSSRVEEGLKLAEELAQQNSKNAQVQAIYGQLLLMMDRPTEAAKQLKIALEIDPNQYNLWQQLLFTYTGPSDADSLLKYSDKALALFPNQAMFHYLHGLAQNYKKDYKKAAATVKRAIDIQPEDNKVLLADMYSLLGDIYNSDKQYKLSDEAYEKALELSPDNASVLNNYSYYLSERGIRLEDAKKMSARSLELRPNEATFLDTYGWILYKSGEYEEARKYIQQAIDANSGEADATLWEHLGDIHFKLNQPEKAVEYWQRAKEKGSDNPQIDKKIQERKLYE